MCGGAALCGCRISPVDWVEPHLSWSSLSQRCAFRPYLGIFNFCGNHPVLEASSQNCFKLASKLAATFGGSGGFSVFANLSDETELSVSFNNGDTNRRARIDGDSAPLSDLSKHIRIVWLTPKEDRLFVDSASENRGGQGGGFNPYAGDQGGFASPAEDVSHFEQVENEDDLPF